MNVRKVNYKDETAPREFTRSLRQTGFSVLTDHPIDMSLIETVYSEWAAFFGSNKKDKYLFDPTKQDGYFPFMTENAKGQSIKDLKEFFHIYSWGRYPEELSNNTRNLYDQLIELTSTLLGWIQEQTPEDVRSLFSIPLPEMIVDSKTLSLIHI